MAAAASTALDLFRRSHTIMSLVEDTASTNMGVATTTMAIPIIVETEVTQEDTEEVVTIMGTMVVAIILAAMETTQAMDHIVLTQNTRGTSVR